MNRIEEENQHLGTTAWRNAYASVDGRRRSSGIEGYCAKNSYMAGETLEVFVSSGSAFYLDLYRMGFYGGNGARHMQQIGYAPGGTQDDPTIGILQLHECDWIPSIAFTIPDDWLSGVYIDRLTQVDVPTPTQSYVVFVLRDERSCDFIFKCSDTTWSAYNAWPDEYSLYDFYGPPTSKSSYWGPGIQVSWDRPYALSKPYYAVYEPDRTAWMIGASQFLIFEFPLLFWMESRGYDVSYISCMDLHNTSSATLRRRARALLAVGHDEYYSVPMHDNLKGAVDASDDIPEKGLSVAFFCGGSFTGVIEVTPSSTDSTRQNRIVRRIGRWGPIEPWLLNIQPEQSQFTETFPDSGELMGAHLIDPAIGVADWVCTNTHGNLASQIYRGTGLADGDRIHNLVGHEFTGDPANIPGLEILAEGNLIGDTGQPTSSQYTATIYPGAKENFVFNASSMWWPQWLNVAPPMPYPPGYELQFSWPNRGVIVPDPIEMAKVEQMTINLFEMFLR